MRTKTVLVSIVSAAMLMAPMMASAFEVQPMRHSVYPENGQISGLLTVRNTRSNPLPVELVVEKRVFDENGEVTLVPADDDFIIFPFQALIEPGASQAFRFQYIGEQVLEEEAAYTINVREVPVDLEGGFTGLRYVYSFGVVVYVEKAREPSQLTVGAVSRDENALKVRLQNAGNSFARLTNDRIVLSQDDRRLVLEGEALMRISNQVVIPPNRGVDLTLNLTDLDLDPGDVSVELRETPD